MMHKILVSRCLLGHRVRYDGGASGPFDQLSSWLQEGRVVALCPEVAGGSVAGPTASRRGELSGCTSGGVVTTGWPGWWTTSPG